MNVLYAPGSYGTLLSAPEAVERMESIAAEAGLFITGHPMSAGGVGLIDVLRSHGPVELHGFEVLGPSGEPVYATAARRKGVWWIESAEAVGLHHLSGSGLEASSFGLGQLILRVAHTAPGPIMIGLSDSATVDGGIGMLQALGYTLRDQDDRVIKSPATGKDLSRIGRIDGPAQISNTVIRVLCNDGATLVRASEVTGRRVGLSGDERQECSRGMRILVDALGGDPTRWATGAAGGIAFTLATVLRAVLGPGAALMAKVTGLNDTLAEADLVIAGGDRLEEPTQGVNASWEVHRRAEAQGRTSHALVGRILSPTDGFAGVEEIGAMDLDSFDSAARRLCMQIASIR